MGSVFFITIGINTAIRLASLPLSIRVQTTLHASTCNGRVKQWSRNGHALKGSIYLFHLLRTHLASPRESTTF